MRVLFVMGLWLVGGIGLAVEKNSADASPITLGGKPYVAELTSLDGENTPRQHDVVEVAGFQVVLRDKGPWNFVQDEDDRARLYLQQGDKRTLVGVEVSFTYEGRTRTSINPLAKLSAEEVRGLWGINLEDWPNKIEESLKQIDPAATCISLALNIGSRERTPLPKLPSGLRYLFIEQNAREGFTDFESLRGLTDLRVFEIKSGPGEFDLRDLSGARQLRVLALFNRTLENVGALAEKRELRTLQLVSCTGISDLGFSREWPNLREIELARSSVTDLSGLSSAESLRTIKANNSKVSVLPAGQLPALVEMSLFSTPVSGDDVEQFRKAHPKCVVHHGWNRALRESVAKADRVRVRTGGVCHRSIDEEKTLFETKGLAEVRAAIELIEVHESDDGGHCQCCGEPTFEFYEGERLVAMIGFHHSRSIRWVGGWPADGLLTDASADRLTEWLAKNGVTGPQDERKQLRLERGAAMRHEKLVAEVLPKAVAEKLDEARSLEEAVAAFGDGVPDGKERAAVCFRVLGCNRLSWNLLTKYERLVGEEVLTKIDKKDVSAALLLAAEDRLIAAGAARWLFAERKETEVDADALDRVLDKLVDIGATHPRTPNRRATLVAMGRIKSTKAVAALRKAASGGFTAGKLSAEEAEEPGGYAVFHPSQSAAKDEFSDRVNAAIVLTEIKDKESEAMVRDVLKEAKADEAEALRGALSGKRD